MRPIPIVVFIFENPLRMRNKEKELESNLDPATIIKRYNNNIETNSCHYKFMLASSKDTLKGLEIDGFVLDDCMPNKEEIYIEALTRIR